MWEYIVNNLPFFIIIVVCVCAMIAVAVVLAVTAKKAKGKPAPFPEEEKGEKEQAATPAQTEQAAAQASDKSTAYSGKWVITCLQQLNEQGQVAESQYYYELRASNGEMMLLSEQYTSLRGVKEGIERFKANATADNFKISPTKKGKKMVKVLTPQGMLLAQGATYNSASAATAAISSIKRFASSAQWNGEVQFEQIPFENVTPPEEKKIDESKKGKWKICPVADEEGKVSYCFELHASNGQLLLTSENYTTVSGAKEGIDTHKSNIASDYVATVITRSGDYINKVYTADGRLLALGEHYKTKQLCLNALASIKRFSASAEIDESEVNE